MDIQQKYTNDATDEDDVSYESESQASKIERAVHTLDTIVSQASISERAIDALDDESHPRHLPATPTLRRWAFPLSRMSNEDEIYDDIIDDIVVESINRNNPQEPNSNNQTRNQDIIIDPEQTAIVASVPVVDGVVVPPRRCYLKICGYQVFDDIFPHLINPKAWPLLALLLILMCMIPVMFIQSNDRLEISSPPTSFIDERRKNITENLFQLSGDVLLDGQTAQNRALEWLIEEDMMNLTYTSPNLLQRYVCMVLFYSLSGEHWVNGKGYGSGKHECTWFGINCSIKLKYSEEKGPVEA